MITVPPIQIQMFDHVKWMDQVYGKLLQYRKLDNINFQVYHLFQEKEIFGNRLIMEVHGLILNSAFIMDFNP